MAKRVDGLKREEWRERLGKYDESGLTVVEFCRRERVSQRSFSQCPSCYLPKELLVC